MSTNVSFSGLSIRINENKTDVDSLKELAKFLDYSEKELEYFDTEDFREVFYELKKNKWRIYEDSNTQLGVIYLINNEYDVFDLEFKLSLEKLNELMGEILNNVPKEYLNMDAPFVNTFAYLYYNGSENPFTF
jgi:hypothetical protein